MLLLASGALMIALSSCQKESSGDLPAGGSLKIKTYTEDVKNGPLKSVTTYNVTYDGSNRITALTDAANTGNKIQYGYPSATLRTVDLFVFNIPSIHADYYLNDHSMIDSSFQYNDTDDSTTEKYTYNAAHQLIQMKEYEYSKITGAQLMNTTSYTYDGSGNLIKTQDTDGFTETYTYYADLVKVLPDLFAIAASSDKANLPKTYELKYGANVEISLTYAYTFDSKDRVSTVTETYSDGTIVVKTYTYVD